MTARLVALGLCLCVACPGCLLQRVPTGDVLSCSDLVRNGRETDVDCGGGCPPCVDGSLCIEQDDCMSGVCTTSRCIASSCFDGVANGVETDVDCGGRECEPCRADAACLRATDCVSEVCNGGVCAASSCDDGVRNEGEADVDCGGDRCPGCAGDRSCAEDADCASLICATDRCTTASCTDGVANQGESAPDCGGTFCPGCLPTQRCNAATDCVSRVCTEGACAAERCDDGVANGTETDVDCGGGTCGPCPPLAACAAASDCDSGVCTDSVCVAATCEDAVRNGAETDVDCGGGTCATCPDLRRCAMPTDCASGMCTEGFCGACVPFGMPDAFGYVGCTFMAEPGVSACPDISATTPLMIDVAMGDDAEVDVPIGFDFPFYGDTRSTARVGMNGAIVFGPMDELSYENQCFPLGAEPNEMIAPYWDDLVPDRGGAVRAATVGMAPDRELVVRWTAYHYAYRMTGGAMLDVTAVLSEDGTIRFCYGNTVLGSATEDRGASATVGISHSATESLTYSCNASMVPQGLVVLFSRP